MSRNKRPTANELRPEAKHLMAPDPTDRPSMTAWITADLYDDDFDQPDAHEPRTDPKKDKKKP